MDPNLSRRPRLTFPEVCAHISEDLARPDLGDKNVNRSILGYSRSPVAGKRYRAYVFTAEHGKPVRAVDFGSLGSVFRDRLGKHPKAQDDHGDAETRKNWMARHSARKVSVGWKEVPATSVVYSPAFFSAKLLW